MGGSYRDMCPKLVQYYNEGYNHCCMYKIIKHTTETFNSRTASDDVEIPDKYRVMFNKLVPLLLQNYNRNISSFDNFIAFVKWALGELGETSIDIAT